MSDDWVQVRTCVWLHEAEFLRSVLESGGIETIIPDEHTIGVQPFYAPLLGGVRVLVRAEDLERAAELLDSVAASDDEQKAEAQTNSSEEDDSQ